MQSRLYEGDIMDILTIGSRTFSFYISESELRYRNIEPDSVTASQARELVRGFIGRETGPLLMDFYPGRHELLIFVRSDPQGPRFISFDNIEELINASLSVTSDLTSSLFFYHGQYILAMWSWEQDDCVPLLEFGRLLDMPPEFLPHLREHGRIIAKGLALHKIKSAFSPA